MTLVNICDKSVDDFFMRYPLKYLEKAGKIKVMFHYINDKVLDRYK